MNHLSFTLFKHNPETVMVPWGTFWGALLLLGKKVSLMNSFIIHLVENISPTMTATTIFLRLPESHGGSPLLTWATWGRTMGDSE
jgi:hypothetical protein